MDEDFSGDMDARQSMIDFMFSLFEGPVSWRSCLQPIIALSTTKVEYIGVMEATKEALWLKGLALEMDLMQEAVRMHCDSQSSICLWCRKLNLCHGVL